MYYARLKGKIRSALPDIEDSNVNHGDVFTLKKDIGVDLLLACHSDADINVVIPMKNPRRVFWEILQKTLDSKDVSMVIIMMMCYS